MQEVRHKRAEELPVTIKNLKAVSYIKTESLGDGRVVNLMPLWDGAMWHQWFDLPDGLIEGKVVAIAEGDYVGKGAAKATDLFIPFDGAEQRRKRVTLPDTFSKMVLVDKKQPRTRAEIEQKYGIPRPLAEAYAYMSPFFSGLRAVRDNVVHGPKGIGHVFDTERGFCIDPKRPPFCEFTAWRPEHYYNENIASVLPWVADVDFADD